MRKGLFRSRAYSRSRSFADSNGTSTVTVLCIGMNARERFVVAGLSIIIEVTAKFNIALRREGSCGKTRRKQAGAAWPLVRKFITPPGVNRNLFYDVCIRRAASYFDSPCAIVTVAHYSLSPRNVYS